MTSFTLFDGPHCPALPAGIRDIAEFMPLKVDRYGLPLGQDREETDLVVADEMSDLLTS